MIQLELSHLLTIVALLAGMVSGLLGMLWSNLTKRIDRFELNMQDRLRTLGHEDRDIRQQIANYITTSEINSIKVEDALDRVVAAMSAK